MGKHKQKGPFNCYKGELRGEIQHFCRENAISDEEFHFLPIHNWENVYDKAVEAFAEYEWARHNGLHWLNTNGKFKKDIIYAFDSYEPWEWVQKLPELLEGKYDKLYFMVEDWGDKFWVAEGTPEVIAQLLYEEMYLDDYYITDKKFNWMITCNHHCIVMFIGDDILYAAEKCRKMIEDWEQNVKENLIKNLYSVDSFSGCTEAEIAFMKQMFGNLPPVLENFYKTVAKTENLHHIQDSWMLPEHFTKYSWLNDAECLIIMNENQGVCQAGIRREDLTKTDPPVYVKTDDNDWVLSAPSTSEFLMAMLGYQAPFAMKHQPEAFYWITQEELVTIQVKMNKLSYEVHNWLYEMKISLYTNAPDNIVAVMDCGGDLQVLYGANSEDGYATLMTVMEGIGEEM